MEKKTTDLLAPRYKVIADYPSNEFEVGDILTLTFESEYETKEGGYWYVEDAVERTWSQGDLDRYPHLFKKLEWWDEREPEDMPNYVRKGGDVYKVEGWKKEPHNEGYPNVIYDFPLHESTHAMWFQPATETEYLNYKRSKHGKETI